MKIIYSKYNRERLPQFQTETTLYIESGVLYAKKRALTSVAREHIENMYHNYNKLVESMGNIMVAKSNLAEDSITFEYIASPTLATLLIQSVLQENKEEFFHYLNEYKKMVLSLPLAYVEEFTPSIESIFGNDIQLNKVMCLKISNIDLTFDNVTYEKNGKFCVIDYEWVFETNLPVAFVLYRAINEFYAKFPDQLTQFVYRDELYRFFNIDLNQVSVFEKMEANFQNYVFGQSREFSAAEKVAKGIIRLEDINSKLLSLEENLQKSNLEIEQLNDQIRLENEKQEELVLQLKSKDTSLDELNRAVHELNTQISQLNEELNCKESEILSKEIVFSSKENELSTALQNKDGHINLLLERERILDNILNSHGWRLLNKYYKVRDKIVPQGTKRRVLLKLTAKTLKHPKLMLSKVNKSNFKKLKYYLKSEDPNRLASRIDAYVERHEEVSVQQELQIYAVEDYKVLKFEKQDQPLVSIIIPVYNQWDYTYACLVSILENTSNIPYEIVIADDMSTDETTNIQSYVENVAVVRDGINRGFLLNCNNAAKVARGKFLFFLNNDTNVQQNWLSSLLELIEADSSIGMAGSKLVYPDGRQQEAGGIIWDDASGWNYGRLDDPGKPEYNYVKDVDYISGAAILVRKDLWDLLEGFDERYVPAYFEDTDLAFEIRKLGYRVVLQPKSVIVHFEGVSHGTDTGSGIKSYQVKNKEKFLEKWQEELSANHLPNAEHVFWARDRSGKQKTVVVVDHYVPHYDKDAGGRCTYFYIKLMKAMGLHVIFIGDNFFKHEPYTTELQQIGVEVLYGNEYAKNIHQWIKTNGQYLDYVYLNRPHIAIKYMDSFKKNTNAKIIYFGHDLHYLREMRNYEITKNPALLKSAEEWKKTEFTLFEQADVIHVVGSFEQKVLQEQFPGKPVRNIPLFPYEKQYNEGVFQYQERKDLLFVGGFNHTPNYDGITWFINDIFPQIMKAIPEIRLYIVGSNPPEDLKAMQSKSIIVTGYVSDEELEDYYKKSRIIVVPLRYGAGVKGKVVEALYYQVPLVTTSIGSEGLVNTEDVMMVADDSEQFANSVIQLYEDETQWSSLSRLSGEYIGQYFTREAAQKILALDINEN